MIPDPCTGKPIDGNQAVLIAIAAITETVTTTSKPEQVAELTEGVCSHVLAFGMTELAVMLASLADHPGVMLGRIRQGILLGIAATQ